MNHSRTRAFKKLSTALVIAYAVDRKPTPDGIKSADELLKDVMTEEEKSRGKPIFHKQGHKNRPLVGKFIRKPRR